MNHELAPQPEGSLCISLLLLKGKKLMNKNQIEVYLFVLQLQSKWKCNKGRKEKCIFVSLPRI